jgi:uroporphyrinogen-III synthase
MTAQPEATLLLTRPAEGGERFLELVRPALTAAVQVVASPLLAPRFLSPPLPGGPATGVIFTSEAGVEGARRISAEGAVLPRRAWCVGARTAAMARAAGFDAVSAEGDAAALVALILAAGERGPLWHLRGEDSRGDVAGTLSAAGTETISRVVYRQDPCALTPAAGAALAGGAPVVAPLFSPRTALVLAAALQGQAVGAPLHLVAMSGAVARAAGALAPASLRIAAAPEAAAMAAATLAALHDLSSS